MDETDTSNHQASGNVQRRPPDSARQALITLERSQKLDLLIHLLTNLQQPLVLCGPMGIGKTTLLDILRAKEISSWHICSIQATSQLSFERVQQLLVESAKQANPDLKHYQLPEILEHIGHDKEKLVVLLDDAGELVPGVITALYQFAAANPVLRFVFVLTPDQLHVKSSSDKVIEDCHFIELPPLTEQQCGEFLQNLSSKPGAPVSFNAISSAMVEKLYRETHGIPGKIMAIFPTLDSYGPASTNTRLLLSLLTAAVIATATGYLLWGPQEARNNPQGSSLSSAESRKIEISPPLITATEKTPEKSIAMAGSREDFPAATAEPLSVDTKPAPSAAPPREEIEMPALESTIATVPPVGQVLQPESSKPQPELNETPAEPVTLEKAASITQKKISQVIIPAAHEPETAQLPAWTAAATKPAPASKSTVAAATEKIPPAAAQTEKHTPPAVSLNAVETAASSAEINPTPAPKDAPDTTQADEAKPKPAASTTEKPKPVNARKSVENDASQWLLQQPPRNYTLQLMALSKRQGAQQILRQYSQLPQPLRYFRTVSKGREKFVVVYGSFATPGEAAKAKKNLPAALRNTWLRRLSGLQKQIAGN